MGRELTDHIVPGDSANHQIKVIVADEPGPGNANHRYVISHNYVDDLVMNHAIQFQNGPIKEVGVNGVTNEALLAIVIDRMSGFQNGPYACRENAIVLTKLQEALMWLQRRTVERIRRGVEGTHEK